MKKTLATCTFIASALGAFATATVTDSRGNVIPFTPEGTDLIRFATTEGETYTVTGISAVVKVSAPVR